jgi:hypothetical protein
MIKLGSTWGQPGVNQGSFYDQPEVNLHRPTAGESASVTGAVVADSKISPGSVEVAFSSSSSGSPPPASSAPSAWWKGH